jgi:diadenosine tetraphosphate (Ap4A) HIT family hydrolase/SAM-dependent methyltransferase
MKKHDIPRDECDLCQEVALAGTWVTGEPRTASCDGPFSRLISRTSIVDLVAGLGGLIPGYVLLIPRRHVRSMGELTAKELKYVYEKAWAVSRRIRHEFGGSTVLVEHGSSGGQARDSGVCVEHAHIHIFPLDAGVSPEDFVVKDNSDICSIADLNTVAGKRQNYYYCAWETNEGYLSVAPVLDHQHARRVWADLTGKRDEWDWAAAPYFNNARLTVSRLRLDEYSSTAPGAAISETELGETINAYDLSAEWYAERTRAFPGGSALPREIEELASGTHGLILDAGAGAGRDTQHFAELGRPVLALDSSRDLLDCVPRLGNISRIVGDVRRLPFDAETVGAVWCSAVLLHLRRDDVLTSLCNLFRVMRTGAMGQISVKEGTGHSSAVMRGPGGPIRHFFYYQRKDLVQLAKLAGFDIVRTWSENEADTSAAVRRWIKLLLRKPTL